MCKEYVLNLNSINDLNTFVKTITRRISCDVNAKYDNQLVDAKSYLGLMSISTHPVTVQVITDDEDTILKFGEICEKYTYKEKQQYEL